MNLTNKTYVVPKRELSAGEVIAHDELVLQSKQREKNTRKKNKDSFKLYNIFLKK